MRAIWETTVLGEVAILVVKHLSLLLANSDGPARDATPCFHFVDLAVDEEELGFEPVSRAAVLLTLVMLAAILDPAVVGDLMGATLVAAKDVRDNLPMIARSKGAGPVCLSSADRVYSDFLNLIVIARWTRNVRLDLHIFLVVIRAILLDVA